MGFDGTILGIVGRGLGRRDNPVLLLRRTGFELLEPRWALSASALAALDAEDDSAHPQAPPLQHAAEFAPVFRVDETVTSLPIQLPAEFQLEPLPSDALNGVHEQYVGIHESTGVRYARDEFGFRGAGQTVAVIDSGVAWDHVDLGAGFGAGHRVVGGWDFAENDANPYDDAPAGYHGTHVAGIVGSSNSVYSGVAPEADIVALRVFDDNGNGYFHWVEQALRWVHDHRDDFENPITAVNLSLGASWNADNVPGWAMLEDEFAQLEADGIFIAVAAGNSFQQYNAPGLSYPAVSPYVTPVASTDTDGSLSSFSQRNDRVLAAPGRNVTSTVPDARGNNNGLPDDYGSASGTSMASPYVAGASLLVREAMEFVGYDNITQSTIYDHLRNTAQIVFDPATSANYHRIDVESALNALMPEDEFGAGVAAHDLGLFSSQVVTAGVINSMSDTDAFTFTASVTGEMRWDVIDSTHQFQADWAVEGAELQTDGDAIVFDVVRGERYTVSLASSNGIGRYSLQTDLTSTDPNFGVVDVAERSGMRFEDEVTELTFTASRTGLTTVEAFFAAADGNINLRVKDHQGRVVGFGGAGGDNERIDAQVFAGRQYTIEVLGSNDDVDMRLTNLVHVGNGVVSVFGTDGDDVISVSAGGVHHVQVNGVDYHFADSETRSVRVLAGNGEDQVRMTGSYARDYAEMRAGYSRMASSDYEYQAVDAEVVHFDSVGRDDLLRLWGSEGDDWLRSDVNGSTLIGDHFALHADGFERVYVDALGGQDVAELHDTHGADRFIGRADHSILQGVDYYKHVAGFVEIDVIGSTGRDVAELYDTDGDESFVGRHDVSTFSGEGFAHTVRGFDEVRAHAGAGQDQAELYDSSGNDRYTGRQSQSSMRGESFVTLARGFDRVSAFAVHGGRDIANVYDTNGDDSAHMRHNETIVQGEDYYNAAHSFDQVALRGSGGSDVVHFYDSVGNDRFYGHSTHALLRGDGFYNQANGFDSYFAHAINGGVDDAQLYDSSGRDSLTAFDSHAIFEGGSFRHHVGSFDRVFAYSNLGGDDTAVFYDSSGNDQFRATATQSEMWGDGFYNFARGFDAVEAHSVHGGNDLAELRDSNGNDTFVHDGESSRMTGQNFESSASGFARVIASASGGVDHADLTGSESTDLVIVRRTQTTLTAPQSQVVARGFESVSTDVGAGHDHLVFQDVRSDQTVSTGQGFANLSGPSFESAVWSVESWEFAPGASLAQTGAVSNMAEPSDAATENNDSHAEVSASTRHSDLLSQADLADELDGLLRQTRDSADLDSELAQWLNVLEQIDSLLADTQSIQLERENEALDDLFSTLGAV